MALPLRNSRIRLSHGQIFWREVGTGPVLVFLHGSWSDSSEWIPVLGHLSEDYHGFALDLLGCGDSERPKIHYSIDLEVECLAEFIETLLPNQQIYLIGHSLGGWVAASYALKYPDRIRGLVLLAPEGLSLQAAKKFGGWGQGVLGHPAVVFVLLRSLKKLAKLLRQEAKIKPLLFRWQQILQHSTTCKLLFQRRRAEIKAELLQDKLELLKMPVLILQGKRDTLEAIAQSQAFADLISHSEHHLIDKGGSDLPQELPDEIAGFIGDFVSQS